MKKVSVLGGCGTVGRVATKILFSMQKYDVTVCDKEKEIFERVFGELSKFIKFKELNADDELSIRDSINDADVVLNCIGPYYKYGPKILKESILMKKNYVDVCDDFDATIEDLKFDTMAKENGISCLIGMGSSPGLANVIVKFSEKFLFDKIDSIDIYHAHGGEEHEGPAVVKHRIHSMILPIPVFLDGEYKEVKLFEESGRALEEETEFPYLGKYQVYAYPHPETITLPKYIKGVRRVTNLGLVLPPQYAELIKDIVRVGIVEENPIDINGCKISPLDFSVSYILYKRKELIEKYGPKEPQGCLKITIKGNKNHDFIQYDFSIYSKGKGMGEGTGIPAAIGAILMLEGLIKEKGVFPPEGGVDPIDLFKLLYKIMEGEKIPILIERIKNGEKETIDVDTFLKNFLV